MLQRTLGLAALSLLLVVSSIQAQGPRGGGRGGFGGGFGGPGFGGPGGAGGPTVSLLNMPELLKELNVSDEQKAAIEKLSEETQDQIREAMGDFRELQDLGDEERQQRMDEARKKFVAVGEQSNEKLGKILDAKQLERLNQIKLQREGLSALSKPETVKALALSDEQVAKLRELQPQQRPGQRASREERQQAETDALAVLTDEQKTKWTELQGKKFDFPEPRFGGGFGGGRGGFGGERGGRGGGGGGGFGGGRGRGPAEERIRPPSKKE